jgi:2-hydroxy-6-oxonona-2,4-dienedioate hydrolase
VPFERSSAGLVLLRDVWDLGPRRAVDMIRIALHDPIEQKLSRMVAPTLVVRGTRDAIVPQHWAEEATRLLPNGRLVVIERVAHTINYSQPAWLAEVVLPFLTGDHPDDESEGEGKGTTMRLWLPKQERVSDDEPRAAS